MQSSFRHMGLEFKTTRLSPRDSTIFFRWGVTKAAGVIEQIVEYQDAEGDLHTMAVVRKFNELNPQDAQSDPYRRHGLNGGKLYYLKTPEKCILVSPANVLCHCASAPLTISRIDKACIWVLPLARVCAMIIMLEFLKHSNRPDSCDLYSKSWMPKGPVARPNVASDMSLTSLPSLSGGIQCIATISEV